MKLLSMTDFVLAKNTTVNTPAEYSYHAFLECLRYATFLDKELKIEMLASVNGTSQDLVLFKGFEVTKDDIYLDFKLKDLEFSYDTAGEMYSCMGEDINLGTIEHLLRFANAYLVDLELTDVALEMLK
jgi:hypothetical protein